MLRAADSSFEEEIVQAALLPKLGVQPVHERSPGSEFAPLHVVSLSGSARQRGREYDIRAVKCQVLCAVRIAGRA